jgi:hypothetical protein
MTKTHAEKYETALSRMLEDTRYQSGVSWGERRSGHPEGSVAAHIAELIKNVDAITDDLDDVDLAKLMIFVHTHDTFKSVSRKGAKIADPDSHSSLARSFVEEFIGETELSAIIQHHDVLYSIWRGKSRDGHLDRDRMQFLIADIKDWDLFMTTKIVDNVTTGKDLNPTLWAINLISSDPQISLSFSPILHFR